AVACGAAITPLPNKATRLATALASEAQTEISPVPCGKQTEIFSSATIPSQVLQELISVASIQMASRYGLLERLDHFRKPFRCGKDKVGRTFEEPALF